jgi:hypothetical protein
VATKKGIKFTKRFLRVWCLFVTHFQIKTGSTPKFTYTLCGVIRGGRQLLGVNRTVYA